MTPSQIELVQNSFDKVAPIAPVAANLFYGKLFELDSSLKPMFRGNITEQGTKLMKMIGLAVNGLTSIETLVPVVQGLGIRHVAYGVKEQHYETVGTALIWTLEQGLGAEFTTEVEEAWIETYTLLANVMKAAATEAAAA